MVAERVTIVEVSSSSEELSAPPTGVEGARWGKNGVKGVSGSRRREQNARSSSLDDGGKEGRAGDFSAGVEASESLIGGVEEESDGGVTDRGGVS